VKRLALLFVASCGRLAFDPLGGTTGDGGGSGLQDTGNACPEGFTRAGTSCYRANYFPNSGDGKIFVDAEALCEAQGGHLAVIDDEPEADRIRGLGLLGSDYWVGVSELAETTVYRSVTNDVDLYLPWATGEPDSGVDHCVNFNLDGTMFDNICTAQDDALCEYDGRLPVPAAWGQ
jgi:hypothetical protein